MARLKKLSARNQVLECLGIYDSTFHVEWRIRAQSKFLRATSPNFKLNISQHTCGQFPPSPLQLAKVAKLQLIFLLNSCFWGENLQVPFAKSKTHATRLARIWFAVLQGELGAEGVEDGFGRPDFFSVIFRDWYCFFWRERGNEDGWSWFKMYEDFLWKTAGMNKHDCFWISRVQQMYIHMLRYDLPVSNFIMFARHSRKSLMHKLLWLYIDRLHVYTCVQFCFWCWHLRRFLPTIFDKEIVEVWWKWEFSNLAGIRFCLSCRWSISASICNDGGEQNVRRVVYALKFAF